jgi:predicted transcriptional regulator
MSDEPSSDVTSLTVQLLSAYLSNNTVPSSELAELIAVTRSALAATVNPSPVVEEETYEPAVSIRKSIASRDHIISMIDGKSYKMLKRHLALNGLTPAEYRVRYNLPSDYPMVAASYSERRREVAKTLGLGRKGRQVAVEAPVANEVEVAAAPDAAPAKPANKPKAAGKAPAKAAVAPEPAAVKTPRKAKVKAIVDAVETAAAPAEKKVSKPKAAKAAVAGAGAEVAAAPKRARKVKPAAATAEAAPEGETVKPAATRRMARKPKVVEGQTA